MSDIKDSNTEIRLLGQALAYLRETTLVDGKKLSQTAAGARCLPPFTAQGWHLHEAGKVKGIEKLDVQRKLVAALGCTVEDLMLARAKIREVGSAAAMAAAAAGDGLRERGVKAFEGPGMRTATFPLQSGDAALSYPEILTPAAIDQLEAYFAMFIRTARSRAAN